jgi:colanic acid biosynthesis protein WcaH
LFLPKADFTQVIANTPLISIDFVVKNPQNQFLLGWRNNRPAKNHWFVPGGRIQKNECLENAFLRLTQVELGLSIAMTEARWKGLYEHFYDDFVFTDESPQAVSTHYVVLAFDIEIYQAIESLPSLQHANYQWMYKHEILTNAQVHNHSKAYFK